MANYTDYGYTNYEACHAHAYIWQRLFQQLGVPEKGPVLDLGCGNGSLVIELNKRGYVAYGTDASVQGIALGNEVCPGRFFLQDLSSDGLPEALSGVPFSTVIATEVIEHLYDPAAMVQFCRRILSPVKNGRLILSTPYHGYLKNLVIALSGKWDQHMNPLWQGGHIKLWSEKTLTLLLQQNGFVVERFTGCGRLPFLWKSMLITARIA